MSGMHMKEFSPTVMCAVRTIEVNRYLENMCGLYKEEDSLTVMCPVRTTKVKRNLENMWGLYMKEVSPTVMFASIFYQKKEILIAIFVIIKFKRHTT